MPWLGTMGEGEGMSPTMGGGTKDMGKGSTDRYLGHLKTVWEGFLFVSTHGLTLGSRGCFFLQIAFLGERLRSRGLLGPRWGEN